MNIDQFVTDALAAGFFGILILLIVVGIAAFQPALLFQLLWNYVAVTLGAPAISYWFAFCGLWLLAIIRRVVFGK